MSHINARENSSKERITLLLWHKPPYFQEQLFPGISIQTMHSDKTDRCQDSEVWLLSRRKLYKTPVEIDPRDPEETHRMSISAVSKTKIPFRRFIFQLISGGWCSAAGARRRANGRWVPPVQMGFMQRSHSNPRPKSFTRPLESSYLFGTKLPFPSLLCIRRQETCTHTRWIVEAIGFPTAGSHIVRNYTFNLPHCSRPAGTPSLFMAARRDNWKHNGFWGKAEGLVSSDLMHRYLSVYFLMVQKGQTQTVTVTNDLDVHLPAPRWSFARDSIPIVSGGVGTRALSPKSLRSERICLERKCSSNSIRLITEMNRSWKEFISPYWICGRLFVSPVKPEIWKWTRVELMRSLLAFISAH